MAQEPRGLTGRIRGVIFDLDGTLIDGYDAIATSVNAARAHFGMPALHPGDVRRRVGLGLHHLMADVLGPERAEEGAAVFRRAYEAACLTGSRAVPDLARSLSDLRDRRVRMTVASNKPALYSSRILAHLGVLGYFVLVAGPETAGAIKPDPAMLRACLAAMGTAPSEAVYVGDMPLDADSGARAGIDVVLVTGGSATREELLETGRPVLEGLGELPAWLAQA
jgi:phosphoglycolate phosphatase